MEGWKVGKLEHWKDGRLEHWKVGRMEGCSSIKNQVSSIKYQDTRHKLQIPNPKSQAYELLCHEQRATSIQYPASSIRVSSIRYQVSGIKYQDTSMSIQYPASSIEHPSIKYQVSSIKYQDDTSIEHPISSIEHPFLEFGILDFKNKGCHPPIDGQQPLVVVMVD
jgi:hypothetical protein